MIYTKKDFGDNFKWGISTAAYQIEGAHNIDGKGLSIWDEFTKKKNKIANGESGDITCDFYNNYIDDLDLIKQLNITNYRFSISWSRIIPLGIGAVNNLGIDFYNKIIDRCIALGIEPWVTLYHWDLPSALQEKGGWVNRDIIQWFKEYVSCCIQHFGDRVKNWMILNEPMAFTGLGYFLGIHAPGVRSFNGFFAAVHHATLCQAEGARLIKNYNQSYNVGTTFSYSHLEPSRPENSRDINATNKMDALLNRLFIEPLLGLGYPTEDLNVLKYMEKYRLDGDDQIMAFDMDFIGLQNYTREIISYSPYIPFLGAKIVKASERKVEQTLMDWEVFPSSIYEALMRYHSYGNIKQILITENGAAFRDTISDNEIVDIQRMNFLKEYIGQVLKAKSQGVNVNGYFVWTLLDNFEWAEGFNPRFGLIHVDIDSQKRTIKRSGKWYADLLSK